MGTRGAVSVVSNQTSWSALGLSRKTPYVTGEKTVEARGMSGKDVRNFVATLMFFIMMLSY